MATQATTEINVVGCDVGKHTIVVFDTRAQSTVTIPNRPGALHRFATDLPEDCFVVCEATGHYEAALLAALVAAGRKAHRADARKVKAFIRSLGTMAKTDAIDARALARYGRERHDRLALWQPPCESRLKLQALVRYRTQLVQHRVAQTNHLKAPGADRIEAHIKTMIDHLNRQIDALEADIDKLLQRHQPLAKTVAIIEAIPGCGHKTAVAIAALMPELGQLTRRRAASLAGLAPHPDRSGRRDGYRRTKGGRPEVKRALFMAALAASRYNPKLNDCYKRLRQNGKKPIVALTALMRKLIVIINAKIRDQLKTADQIN